MILIGSRALAYHIDIERDFNDTDIVGTYEEVMTYVKACKAKVFYPIKAGRKMFIKDTCGSIIEADIAWEDSAEEKLQHFVLGASGSRWMQSCDMVVPSLNVLYMLKMSHRYLKDSPHFLKTMRDIQLMRRHGAKIQPEHQAFYEQRMKDTYVYSHPKLNVSKEAFFDGKATGIVYKYVHDDIHEAVKHLDRPAYTYFSCGPVASDMAVFKTLSESVKLLAVLEEALVLAAERSQLAFPDRSIDAKWSFDKALEKVATSITSGVFREYAYENYDAVQSLYSKVGKDYMERVNCAISEKRIRSVSPVQV